MRLKITAFYKNALSVESIALPVPTSPGRVYTKIDLKTKFVSLLYLSKMKKIILSNLPAAALSLFVISLVGLGISYYETSGAVLGEYIYHCGGPGTQDRLACMDVYYRNRAFYQTVLQLSLPTLLISGILTSFLVIVKRNEHQ